MSNILFACSAERGYVRNRVLVRALRRNHKLRVLGSNNRRYPVRFARVIPRVLTSTKRYDHHFAGFLGQPLVPFMWARGMRPLILDAFVSVYDTLVLDREQHSRNSPYARLTHWLDSWSIRKADLVLVDTPASAEFFAREFGADPAKLLPVPVGADESVFFPRERRNDSSTLTVLYLSTYLPLHGVDTVVNAAGELKDPSIRFVIVGRGPERANIDALVRRHALDKVEFIDWLPFERLPELIADCDIFLGGHFSRGNEKAQRVVPGKVFQGLAMQRPVILGDCRANRDWFEDGTNARFVPMADPVALARAISDLAADPSGREEIARAGRALYERWFSEEAIAALLDENLRRLQSDRSENR